jgi:hypothetical protein
MTFRPACAAVGALLVVLSLAACGSDSSSSAGTNAGTSNSPGNARGGFLRDPKVVACLKKQGVTIPSRPRSGDGGAPGGQDGQPPNGQPPNGQPANEQPPSGQGGPNRDSAQMQKLRTALQKCGVDFGGRPPNGQSPQGQGTSSTSAS